MLLQISADAGYTPLTTDAGISSSVFVKEKRIYKLTKRNPVERVQADYKELQKVLGQYGFAEKIQQSLIYSCLDSNKDEVTCVEQDIINGQVLARVGEEGLRKYLQVHEEEKRFLVVLVEIFLERVKLKQLYPDIVGNPQDPSLWQSINLMQDNYRGIILCDVGLSPHADTLEKHGQGFFDSENVIQYTQKMRDALLFLQNI